MKSVVSFAREIIDMEDELRFLRRRVAELEHFEQKYHDEVQASIAHNQKMIGGLLGIVSKPGVMDAIGKANAEVDHTEPGR